MLGTTNSVVLIILTVSSSLLFPISEQYSNCSPINPMNITNCKKLVTLGAEFGWNIHSNTEINILFTIRPPAKWIAWGVNPGPQRPEMVGTRAVIGISQPNGTLAVRKYNITSDTKLGCRLKPSQNFDDVIVKNMKGEVKPRRYKSIFATLILPPDPAAYNILKLNHVWQVGFEADDALMEPKMHSTSLQNVDSTETINMTTGRGLSIGHRQHHLRTVRN
ncbi:cytochrome b561 and DOMON domain-containing protein At5g47530-like [Pyrus x bretschneideri]|uniref:cytochrome b561 and DOMON domain-containing protein At5g47530-like n=1 Tax=Pyrus x bretschneideri TaxID=225117 RepID=UPI00202ED799|nr:cytochrome b561 and DOMON domain-containing protein At5g47530-like [Pyrus x bretschneideri]